MVYCLVVVCTDFLNGQAIPYTSLPRTCALPPCLLSHSGLSDLSWWSCLLPAGTRVNKVLLFLDSFLVMDRKDIVFSAATKTLGKSRKNIAVATVWINYSQHRSWVCEADWPWEYFNWAHSKWCWVRSKSASDVSPSPLCSTGYHWEMMEERGTITCN